MIFGEDRQSTETQIAPPSRHATSYPERGAPVIGHFEPGEEWFFDYRDDTVFQGPSLAAPTAHPVDQPVPGPEGAVPPDWMDHIHQ